MEMTAHLYLLLIIIDSLVVSASKDGFHLSIRKEVSQGDHDAHPALS